MEYSYYYSKLKNKKILLAILLIVIPGFALRLYSSREIETTSIAEQSGRSQDKEKEYMMQKLRSLGYM